MDLTKHPAVSSLGSCYSQFSHYSLLPCGQLVRVRVTMQNTCSVETPCKVVKWGGSQTSYIVLSVWWMDSGCYHYKRMARQKTRANIWGGYHKRNIIMFHVYYLTRKFKINSILKLDLNFPSKKNNNNNYNNILLIKQSITPCVLCLSQNKRNGQEVSF